MAYVKMKTAMVGNDLSYAAGDIVEVSAEVAKAWEEAEIAEKVTKAKDDEIKKHPSSKGKG